MALTRVAPNIISVANNVTNKTVGNTTSIASVTFDGAGVVTAASNVAISGAGITANTIANSAFQTGSVENYMNAAGLGFGMRNRIINGAMVIDQRNAGAAITTTGFVVDRFSSLEGTAGYTTLSVSSQQSTDTPSNFTNSIKVTVNTGQALTASRYLLAADHRIEGFNFASLGFGTAAAQSFTLSFWVKASVTGTYPVAFFNSGVSRAYLGTYTVNSANTWEQKSITVAGDTSGTWNTTNGIGLGMQFAISAGSDSLGTAGAWSGTYKRGVSGMVDVASTTGATWFITGVQLEVGSTATSFDYRQYGTELALCMRYMYAIRSTNASNGDGTGLNGVVGSTTGGFRLQAPNPVIMRTSPSLTFSNVSAAGTDLRVYDGSNAPDVTSIGTNFSNTNAIQFDSNSSGGGLTVGRASVLLWQNSINNGYIWVSAEL